MCLYGTYHPSERKKAGLFNFVIPSGKSCQSGVLVLALVIYQPEPHGKIVCLLQVGIFPEEDTGTYALGFSP